LSDVLIVGSGGREHALGWKISKSAQVKKIYYASGNGGTTENIGIAQNDIQHLLSFAKRNNALTVIGPEEPLSHGIVDAFLKEGLRIFGPTKNAAMLETSKAFAKEFMREAGIPTAKFEVFSSAQMAKDYVLKQDKAVVVKADGLAAGKGVVVSDNADQALTAIDAMMIRNEFGSAGSRVVIEERLTGKELSFIAICDGKSILPLASSQDHKRLFDGDKGPNTGGMGAYSPSLILNSDLHDKITKQIMEPAMNTMKRRGTPFKGFLYAGIMVDEKTRNPYLLEFNARMGDPECQPIMFRMKSDLYQYIDAAVDERLRSMPPIEWKEDAAVCVVMAARGYPGKYEKGKVIEGLDAVFGQDVMVFHAGTTRDSQNRIVTNGGRVLGITALGQDVKNAADKAYSAVRRIHWGNNDNYYRTDIARHVMTH
jgi:phosphoribosylamine---glycine ligase